MIQRNQGEIDLYWKEVLLAGKKGNRKLMLSIINEIHKVFTKSIKVSIIVPVYNVEKYLSECLESITNQEFIDFEVIVVNDGTEDNSAEIAKEFAKSCPSFIRVIDKENGGLGSARKVGFENSKGKYISYVDSDDYIDREMIKDLYNCCKKGNDIAICGISAFDDLTGEIIWEHKKPNNIDFNNIRDVIKNSTLVIPPGACNKLFERSLINKAPWGSGFYEDLQAVPTFFSYAQKISYVKKSLYYYRINRRGSIMQTSRDDIRCLAFIEGWKNLLKYANPKYKKEIIYALYVHIISIILEFPHFTEEFMRFFYGNKKSFENNEYIKESISKKEIENLFETKMIPDVVMKNEISKLEAEMEILSHQHKNSFDSEIAKLKNENIDLHKELEIFKNEKDKLEMRKNYIESSFSWKLTRPLRKIRKLVNKIFE